MQNLGLCQVLWAFIRLEPEGEIYLSGGIKVTLCRRDTESRMRLLWVEMLEEGTQDEGICMMEM